MGVLIKDMKMPKSCKSCDLLQDYDGDMYCPLNSYLNFGDIEYVPDYVMIGCPISEAPERKKGKWIPHREKSREYIGTVLAYVEYDYWLCDTCGYRVENGRPMYNFCPDCGADMRGEQE